MDDCGGLKEATGNSIYFKEIDLDPNSCVGLTVTGPAPNPRLGLWLREGCSAMGFDEHLLDTVSKNSGPDACRAVWVNFEILIQIFDQRAVILPPCMYFNKKLEGLRGIGLLTKRFADTFLGLLQAVQA